MSTAPKPKSSPASILNATPGVTNSTFGGATEDLGNEATGNRGLGGGAVSVTGEGSRVTISNASFENNAALAGGGRAGRRGRHEGGDQLQSPGSLINPLHNAMIP